MVLSRSGFGIRTNFFGGPKPMSLKSNMLCCTILATFSVTSFAPAFAQTAPAPTAPEAAKEAEAHGFSPIAPNLIAPIVSQLRQASSRIADSTAFGSNPYKGIVDRVLYRFNPCVNGAGAAEPYAPKLVARPALRLFFVCCISHRCVATGGVPCTSGGWRVHPPTQR